MWYRLGLEILMSWFPWGYNFLRSEIWEHKGIFGNKICVVFKKSFSQILSNRPIDHFKSYEILNLISPFFLRYKI